MLVFFTAQQRYRSVRLGITGMDWLEPAVQQGRRSHRVLPVAPVNSIHGNVQLPECLAVWCVIKEVKLPVSFWYETAQPDKRAAVGGGRT